MRLYGSAEKGESGLPGRALLGDTSGDAVGVSQDEGSVQMQPAAEITGQNGEQAPRRGPVRRRRLEQGERDQQLPDRQLGDVGPEPVQSGAFVDG